MITEVERRVVLGLFVLTPLTLLLLKDDWFDCKKYSKVFPKLFGMIFTQKSWD